MQVVALVADLIFESKIAGTAGHLGIFVLTVRTSDRALAALADASGLIIDMNTPASDNLALIRSARSVQPTLPIVAFLSHVQVELAAQTRAAGATEVLSRSQFTDDLPAILQRLSAVPKPVIRDPQSL